MTIFLGFSNPAGTRVLPLLLSLSSSQLIASRERNILSSSAPLDFYPYSRQPLPESINQSQKAMIRSTVADRLDDQRDGERREKFH